METVGTAAVELYWIPWDAGIAVARRSRPAASTDMPAPAASDYRWHAGAPLRS